MKPNLSNHQGNTVKLHYKAQLCRYVHYFSDVCDKGEWKVRKRGIT